MDLPELLKGIRARRKTLHMTQIDLALRAGVSRRTIISLESGDTDIGLFRFFRVLRSLGLEMDLQIRTKRPVESQLKDMFKDDD